MGVWYNPFSWGRKTPAQQMQANSVKQFQQTGQSGWTGGNKPLLPGQTGGGSSAYQQSAFTNTPNNPNISFAQDTPVDPKRPSVITRIGQEVSKYAPFLNLGYNIWQNERNRNATIAQNERSEAFSREMYDRQLYDTERFWNMQNAYNDPAAQMLRLQEAGLNPNLVYGSGSPAAEASAPSRPNAMPIDRQVPMSNLDPGSVMAQGVMLQQALANISKTKAETSLLDENTTSKAFDNAVNVSVGSELIAQNRRALMATANDRANKEAMEIEQWMVNIAQGSGAGFKMDDRGMRFTTTPDSLLSQQQRQAIEETYERVNNLKKLGLLYDQQHALNEIQKEIVDFRKTLANLGLSDTTLKGATVLITLLKTIFGSAEVVSRLPK